MSKNKVILIVVSVLAVVAVVAGGILWSLKPVTVQERLESSNTYQALDTILSVDGKKPVSLIIAPAEKQWWDTLLDFNSNVEVDGVDFESVSNGANYVAYTISQGKDFEQQGDFGLGTTFIFYSTDELATDAGTRLSNVSYFVKDNVLAFITPGAFSDVDYDFATFYQSETEVNLEDLNLNGQAIMQINFQGFSDAYLDGYPAEKTEVYNNFTSLLGISPESGWVGYSNDGLTWEGQFYNVAVQDVTEPSVVFDYFGEQQLVELTDGSLVPIPTEENDIIIPEEDQTGFIFPRQADLINFMIYETQSDAGGRLTNLETGEAIDEAEVLTDGSLLRLKINVVPWLTIMLDENSSSILSPFEYVEVAVNEADGTSTIVFTPNSE